MIFELFGEELMENGNLHGEITISIIVLSLGFAKAVNMDDLPFVVNWCGSEVRSMSVDDDVCLNSMVKMVAAIDELKPEMEGEKSL